MNLRIPVDAEESDEEYFTESSESNGGGGGCFILLLMFSFVVVGVVALVCEAVEEKYKAVARQEEIERLTEEVKELRSQNQALHTLLVRVSGSPDMSGGEGGGDVIDSASKKKREDAAN